MTKFEKDVARGGKLRAETSDEMEKTIKGLNDRGSDRLRGRDFGGGPRDISHSITDGNKVKKV